MLYVQLDPESPPGAAVKQALLPLFNTMRDNEEAVRSGTDPEGLHDFRVASRRSRVILARAKKVVTDLRFKRCRRDLRWLAKTTNRSRDLDVALASSAAYRSHLPPRDADELLPFEHDLRERRRGGHDKVRNAIDSRRYERFTTQYGTLLTTPAEERVGSGTIADFASAWIWAAYGRVLRKGRSTGPAPSVKDLHKLRLACKRLRYLIEVYESLYAGEKIAELIDTLQEFQTLLGDLHDADVQRREVEEFIRTTTTPATQVVNAFVGDLGDRIVKIRTEFGRRFDTFARPSNEWLFRELFRVRR
jgi:CHAD domain-containing protein